MDISLLGLLILEKDKNNDVLWSWVYPKIENSEKDILFRKCSTFQDNIFFKIKPHWFYVCINNQAAGKLKNIRNYAIIIKSSDYNPSKYNKLAEILSNKYEGNPVDIQKLYWQAFTGNITGENGLLTFKNNIKTIGAVKDLIKLFELHTILIYNALLLKRKVLVYHDSITELVHWIKAIPLLLPQRNPQTYLYPVIEDNVDDLTELKSCKWFVAGTIEKSVLSKTHLYDLIVDIPRVQIDITSTGTGEDGAFTMTKTHKEIAKLMCDLAESEKTSSEISVALTAKTDDLFTQLKSLCTILSSSDPSKKMITLENLRANKFNSNVENFLFHLALAENILML